MLKVNNLHASVEGNEIIRGINLEVKSGEVHAIMGPNGSGKSTFANVLMGNPIYEVTKGSVEYMGEDITDNPADKRAKKGIFMAFQYPEAIPGVTIVTMLKAALSNITDTELTTIELRLKVADSMKDLGLEPDFVDRYLNEGFSGGERKRNEILQLAVLEPRLAILDETDSGLDVDGLKIVGDGVDQLRNKDRSFLIVTHYQRLLNYIIPDFVHILVDGRIISSGDKNLALDLEEKGYDKIIEDAKV